MRIFNFGRKIQFICIYKISNIFSHTERNDRHPDKSNSQQKIIEIPSQEDILNIAKTGTHLFQRKLY